MPVTYLAEATDTSLNAFLSSITGALSNFSVDTLKTILVTTVGGTVGLGIAWFGYRFVIRKVQKALHKGSL